MGQHEHVNQQKVTIVYDGMFHIRLALYSEFIRIWFITVVVIWVQMSEICWCKEATSVVEEGDRGPVTDSQ